MVNKLSLFLIILIFVVNNLSYAKPGQKPVQAKIEMYGATDADNGDNYRKLLRFDLIYNKRIEDTTIFADLRAERDSARDGELAPFVGSTVNGNSIDLNNYATDNEIKDQQQRVYLNQAYISQKIIFPENWIFDSFNFKIGKIKYKWGVSEGLKPCDIINPQDMSFFTIRTIEDRKMSIYSAASRLNITKDLFFEVIAIPDFEENFHGAKDFTHMPIRILASSATIDNINTEELPEDNINDASYAARIGVYSWLIDLNLYGFYGYDHEPVNYFSTSGTLYDVTREYEKIKMFGIDLERALVAGIGFKAESAYFHSGKFFQYNALDGSLAEDVSSDGNGNIEKKYVEFTLGLDDQYLFGIPDLYFKIQYHQKSIMNYDESLALDKNRKIITTKLTYTFFNERINFKIAPRYNINDKEYMAQLEAKFIFNEVYELAIGTWIFKDTNEDEELPGMYGQFDDYDLVYFHGKMKF